MRGAVQLVEAGTLIGVSGNGEQDLARLIAVTESLTPL
jgi:hypothetical protein